MSEGVDIWLYLFILREDWKGRENKTLGHHKCTVQLSKWEKWLCRWVAARFPPLQSTYRAIWDNFLYTLVVAVHSILHFLIPIRNHTAFGPVSLMLVLTGKPMQGVYFFIIFMNLNSFTYIYIFLFKRNKTTQSTVCERNPKAYSFRIQLFPNNFSKNNLSASL